MDVKKLSDRSLRIIYMFLTYLYPRSCEETKVYNQVRDELECRANKRARIARRTEKRKAKRLENGGEWM